MCINFGFAGFQNSNPSSDVCMKITSLMKEFLACAQNYNSQAYGFSEKAIRCSIYSGDIFCTEDILHAAKQIDAKTNVITSAYDTEAAKIAADSVIALDVKKQNLSYPNIIAEYVVNKSDVMFLVWDGKQNFREGILWTILQFCKEKSIPYYLLNTEKLDEVSFSSDSYFVPYSAENLAEYVANLYDYKETTVTDEPIALSRLWLALHNIFINK